MTPVAAWPIPWAMSKSNGAKKLEKWVEAERKKGKSFTQLAALLEMSEGTLRVLVKGERPPNLKASAAIRKHAKINPFDFLSAN